MNNPYRAAVIVLYNSPVSGAGSYGRLLDAQLRSDCRPSLRWGNPEVVWAARLVQEDPQNIESVANSIKFRRQCGEFDNGFKFT